MKPRETKSITIYAPKKFKDELRKKANRLNIGISAYIRMAITLMNKRIDE